MSARAPDLLFDLDGTLTDNYAGIAASIRHALERLGAARARRRGAARSASGRRCATRSRACWRPTTAPTIERAIAHYRERFADVGWQRERRLCRHRRGACGAARRRRAPVRLHGQAGGRSRERIVEHFGFAPHSSRRLRRRPRRPLRRQGDADGAPARDGSASTRRAPSMIGDRGHDIRAARANGVRAVGGALGLRLARGAGRRRCARRRAGS